jgi:hypothetical protein
MRRLRHDFIEPPCDAATWQLARAPKPPGSWPPDQITLRELQQFPCPIRKDRKRIRRRSRCANLVFAYVCSRDCKVSGWERLKIRRRHRVQLSNVVSHQRYKGHGSCGRRLEGASDGPQNAGQTTWKCPHRPPLPSCSQSKMRDSFTTALAANWATNGGLVTIGNRLRDLKFCLDSN